MDNNAGYYNSLLRINPTTFAVAYGRGNGYIKTFTISADGTTYSQKADLYLIRTGVITIPLFALAPIPTPSPIKAIIINQANGEASLKLFLFRKTDQRLKSYLNGPLTLAAATMAIGIP